MEKAMHFLSNISIIIIFFVIFFLFFFIFFYFFLFFFIFFYFFLDRLELKFFFPKIPSRFKIDTLVRFPTKK